MGATDKFLDSEIDRSLGNFYRMGKCILRVSEQGGHLHLQNDDVTIKDTVSAHPVSWLVAKSRNLDSMSIVLERIFLRSRSWVKHRSPFFNDRNNIMSLPYENSSSGANALEEIGKILTRFGCARYGHMTDNEAGHLLVQFTHRGVDVSVKASYRGYAAAWLKEHPYSSRTKATRPQHEQKALEQAKVSVCSILRDWVKSQVTMIEIGVLSFEGAFLGQIMLPNGKSVLDHATDAGLLQIELGAQ